MKQYKKTQTPKKFISTKAHKQVVAIRKYYRSCNGFNFLCSSRASQKNN